MQPKQKLRPVDVLSIRQSYAQGATQREIAQIFNVDQSLISRIVNYKRKTKKAPHKITMPKWYLEEV